MMNVTGLCAYVVTPSRPARPWLFMIPEFQLDRVETIMKTPNANKSRSATINFRCASNG